MKFVRTRKRQLRSYASPWVVIGASCILAAVVLVLAVMNVNRERGYMATILSEKGAALIRSFEAGARTGMMGMMGGDIRLQNLLEETARQEDILYLALVNRQGAVLAHSDRDRIGTSFKENGLDDLAPGDTVKWRQVESSSGKAFEVYRIFSPLKGGPGPRHHMMGMHGGRNFWGADEPRLSPPGSETGAGLKPVIFVGLDIEPFQSAIRQDIRQTFVLAGIILLSGLGGLVALFWAQAFRASRFELEDVQAFASEVVRNLPAGMIVTDEEGRISYVNSTAEALVGQTTTTLLGRLVRDSLPSELVSVCKRLREGETVVEREMMPTFPDGHVVPLSVSASRIVTEDGHFVGNIYILRDLTEVRRLQDEVKQREKLAAIGDLAAGVAHEIRNPLSTVKGFATFLGSKFAEGSEESRAAQVMIRETERLNRVITDLLEFARPSDIKPRPRDLNGLVEHSLSLVASDLTGRGIALHKELAFDLPEMPIDPDRFIQALLNLHLNAMQAMETGGTLSVRTVREEGGAMIEVQDTGHGIDKDQLFRIFDPYFTTKAKGTGLGLAIVHKIIMAHGGEIEVESIPEQGTRVVVHLRINGTKA